MRILLVLVFYGLLYSYFENFFNWVQMDLLNKDKSWKIKLQLRPSNSSSLWHFVSGAVIGLLLYLLFLIPFNMVNILHAIASCIIGGIIITVVELGCGYFLFYILKTKRFWDYSNTKIRVYNKEIKLNFLGLIDIWHSLAWVGLAYVFYLINKLFFG